MRYQWVWASVLSGGGACSAPFPTVPSGIAREQTGKSVPVQRKCGIDEVARVLFLKKCVLVVTSLKISRCLDISNICKSTFVHLFIAHSLFLSLFKVLQAMVSTGQKSKAKEVVEKATSFRSFSDNRRYRSELEFISATTYLLTGDFTRAFDAFRWALTRSDKKGLSSPAMWNFFCRIVNNMPDRKYHKYILRMLFKHPAVLPLIIVNGHNAFLCGSYKYAIGKYSFYIPTF